ncbi:hypothetical protein LZ30DRAFT_742738 [Colletotrichum cereale]|nr:hypothetical protein LZ30DRAFT_742738 [Colletotrichum cereale]
MVSSLFPFFLFPHCCCQCRDTILRHGMGAGLRIVSNLVLEAKGSAAGKATLLKQLPNKAIKYIHLYPLNKSIEGIQICYI